MLAHTVIDKPIVLERLEDRDDNLDITNALYTVDGEKLSHDGALDLNILSMPFNPSAGKLEDGGNDGGDIDNNTSPCPARRQKSASPRCEPDLRRTITSPLPHNQDVEISAEIADGSDSNDSGNDNFSSKRRKLSGSPGGRTTLSSDSGRSPSISEDQEVDGAGGSLNISVDDNLAGTARTTLDVFESTYPTEPQMFPEVVEASRDWEVSKIIGKEYVNGVLHYLVKWCPTLEPVHSLEHAKGLVDEFEARLTALRKDKGGRVGLGAKRDRQMMIGGDTSGGLQKKGRPGQPRKQK